MTIKSQPLQTSEHSNNILSSTPAMAQWQPSTLYL